MIDLCHRCLCGPLAERVWVDVSLSSTGIIGFRCCGFEIRAASKKTNKMGLSRSLSLRLLPFALVWEDLNEWPLSTERERECVNAWIFERRSLLCSSATDSVTMRTGSEYNAFLTKDHDLATMYTAAIFFNICNLLGINICKVLNIK